MHVRLELRAVVEQCQKVHFWVHTYRGISGKLYRTSCFLMVSLTRSLKTNTSGVAATEMLGLLLGKANSA